MRIDETLDKILLAVEPYEFRSFVIGVARPKPYDREEHEAFFRKLKVALGEHLTRRLPDVEVDFRYPDLRIDLLTQGEARDRAGGPVCEVRLQPAPLFVASRYRKLSREIPSSRWIHHKCKGRGCPSCSHTGSLCGPSIQELIEAPVLKHSGGRATLFHALGREDTDARMLGQGRPFVLEVHRPLRRELPLDRVREDFEVKAAGLAEITALHLVDRKACTAVKSAQVEKTYRAWIEADGDLPDSARAEVSRLAGTVVEQLSPTRVQHRRGADTRRRRRILESTWLGRLDRRYVWETRVESGTYVKELVSGDDRRTRPSIAEILGVPCRCAALDVLQVHWQPTWEV